VFESNPIEEFILLFFKRANHINPNVILAPNKKNVDMAMLTEHTIAMGNI
jgi:hypothetical protein